MVDHWKGRVRYAGNAKKAMVQQSLPRMSQAVIVLDATTAGLLPLFRVILCHSVFPDCHFSPHQCNECVYECFCVLLSNDSGIDEL